MNGLSLNNYTWNQFFLQGSKRLMDFVFLDDADLVYCIKH